MLNQKPVGPFQYDSATRRTRQKKREPLPADRPMYERAARAGLVRSIFRRNSTKQNLTQSQENPDSGAKYRLLEVVLLLKT